MDRFRLTSLMVKVQDVEGQRGLAVAKHRIWVIPICISFLLNFSFQSLLAMLARRARLTIPTISRWVRLNSGSNNELVLTTL